jgi:hypothetical protein
MMRMPGGAIMVIKNNHFKRIALGLTLANATD